MKLRTPSIIRLTALLLLLTSAYPVLQAQVLYGSLTGNVIDPSGAAVPSVRVEALNTGTGVGSQTNTDERGAYIFSNLQSGTYKITVSAPSFKTVTNDTVRVTPNQ